ncbi:MAG: hypothetical protein IKK30_02500 [Clostridia bacterium]|nr:hypothetical protein [Clostridia bacterium]
MKKNLAAILVLVLILTSGCAQTGEKEETQCAECDEMCSAYYYYCPNCGNRLYSESNSEPIDYSDYGFENNYGFTEWLWIDGYDFSDSNNAYVKAYYRKHEVFTFENGYLQTRFFKEENNFSGEFSKGSLHTAMSYNIISNSVLIMSDNSTYDITNINMKGNVPIIYTNHNLYRNMGTSITDGTFIPTHFIDFSREPEIIESNTYFGKDVRIKYFIKSEYLEGYVIE